MKKSLSLRSQLSLWMALLVLLLGFALTMALSISNVFLRLDSEAFLQLSNTTTTRKGDVDEALGYAIRNAVHETQLLRNDLLKLAAQYDCTPDTLYLNDEASEAFSSLSAQTIITLLNSNGNTGAFVVLNGSNVNKEDAHAHSAVYIRDSAAKNTRSSNEYYLLEIGPAAVAQQFQIASSIRWDMDFHFEPEDPARYLFYTQPIWASEQVQRAEIERYGYWMTPTDILADNHPVITYSIPLLDAQGKAFGVLGLEINVSYFTQQYLPNDELLYNNSFYVITNRDGDSLLFDWSIASGPLAQIHLQNNNALPLDPIPVTGEDIFAFSVGSLGDMYGAVRTLRLYSGNSPFVEEDWSLVSVVSQEQLHSGTGEMRRTLIGSIVGAAVIALAAAVLLGYVATRKISGLSKYVSNLSPYDDIHIKRTGMKEIDELSSAVEMLNHSVITASKTTSKILDLTLLPVGGYEITADTRQVVLTEYIYRLFHMEARRSISKQRWDEMLASLTKNPAEDIEDVYCYYDELLEKTLWLRIVETEADGSTIGVIVDESRSVEERQRLAHELDYDNLTQLYNRNAFKREVNRAIRDNPDCIGVMIFADLDNLKYINDSFGHEMGDRLIIRAAEIFEKLSEHGGIVSRISGDEFAMYLHGYASQAEAKAVVHDHLRHDDSHILITPDGKKNHVRFSAGLAWYPQDSDNMTDLLKLSDFAMYEAKSQEKGSIHEFDRDSYRKSGLHDS